MEAEYCSCCDKETGNAGKMDGSIYIEYHNETIGPLCDDCRESRFWVCEKCGQGVYNEAVSFELFHIGCGGKCT